MVKNPEKILIIQTAFVGDVILATALVEKLAEKLPESRIDFLCRKGNESLLAGNPKIERVHVFDKKKKKYRNLLKTIKEIRREKYDLLINVQRFFTTSLISLFSGASVTVGFDKSPMSFHYTHTYPHNINDGTHETDRNQQLIRSITGTESARPRLYPSEQDISLVQKYIVPDFVTISPASVWFTKQFPSEKWVELIQALPEDTTVYLLGSRDDQNICSEVVGLAGGDNVRSLAGKLTLLQSAALMSYASMNYCNDSAPLHLASAMNAPVTAVYCSTVPSFGFGPLSDRSRIVETDLELKCRPCGLHGRSSCPEGHFDCALTIKPEQLIQDPKF